jgi:hypothetical protein
MSKTTQQELETEFESDEWSGYNEEEQRFMHKNFCLI